MALKIFEKFNNTVSKTIIIIEVLKLSDSTLFLFNFPDLLIFKLNLLVINYVNVN